MKVRLTYFNERGKYKYEGEYETDKVILQDVFDEVRAMSKRGEYPGTTITTPGAFHVLIDVPDHEFNHPHLVSAFDPNRDAVYEAAMMAHKLGAFRMGRVTTELADACQAVAEREAEIG